MRSMLPCALAALVVLGCARHVVVKPEVVVNRKDPEWTIRQDPEFRPTFAGRDRISLPSGSFCDPGVKLSQNAIALYVEPGAEAAGLRAGDRIASLDGRRVRDRAEFLTRLRRQRPGQSLEVTVERDGSSRRPPGSRRVCPLSNNAFFPKRSLVRFSVARTMLERFMPMVMLRSQR